MSPTSQELSNDAALTVAAQWVSQSTHLLITAGAGMGVDSGLPDFRGVEGFWRAYPAFKAWDMSFYDAATPATFRTDPALAWGFYGHRLDLYRSAIPHFGYCVLRDWASTRESFVFTSNVDGLFQKARFHDDRLVACHGRINVLQCSLPCSSETWSADSFHAEVDTESGLLLNAVLNGLLCCRWGRWMR